MVQPGHRRGLGQEVLASLRALEVARQDHLQRHHALQADLPGLEDDSHAAAAQLLLQLIASDDCVGRQRGPGRAVARGVVADGQPEGLFHRLHHGDLAAEVRE